MQNPPVLVVTGEGTVQAVPDVTVVSLGVTARDAQAAAAFRAAAVALNQVVRALLAAGVPQDQIQTSQISPQQVFQNDRPAGFEASATLRVTVRDRTAIGDLIDRAIAAGANNVTGISFELADPGAAEAMALARAVQNAQGQAAVLARSLGIVLGPVLRVEAEPAPGPITPLFARAAAVESIPILPGTIAVTRRVRVEFMVVR
jgi:uncharacterized protein YggE